MLRSTKLPLYCKPKTALDRRTSPPPRSVVFQGPRSVIFRVLHLGCGSKWLDRLPTHIFTSFPALGSGGQMDGHPSSVSAEALLPPQTYFTRGIYTGHHLSATEHRLNRPRTPA